jgi:hypothetical protein
MPKNLTMIGYKLESRHCSRTKVCVLGPLGVQSHIGITGWSPDTAAGPKCAYWVHAIESECLNGALLAVSLVLSK